MEMLSETPKPPKGGFNTFRNGLIVAAFFGGIITLSGCHSNTPVVEHTPVANSSITHIDSITVYCDESYKELIDQEISIYETELPDKHIHISYLPETAVLTHLLEDSTSYVILGRKVREQEREDIFRKGRLQVEQHIFATDAIAIVANPAMDKDTIAYSKVISLLTNDSHDYRLVFEGNGSGVINYMFAQIAHATTRPSAYAAKNLDELVEYLQNDKSTIGFIPFSRISDENDTIARHLLKKVKVLYVSKPDSSGRMVTATASQSEIADGSYPFDRPVNFIEHSMDEKVGTGFANFLHHEHSGRIILKAGLVPSTMPQRVINVNTEGVKAGNRE